MKKALDQTVRDLKREVNKVMKVSEIEQKVLDSTSNEAWGPHGTIMADIAQATRNYNDYQIIMSIIWKRINDTGKNWRHVYKALTLLEYLVAHGSERVIDELKEHAYQLSTLADFQYIDSRGKDQGQNVRKKSQGLVSLLNDTERIRELRQKAVDNRDKYRSVSSIGGMYKPSSYNSTGGSYGGGDRYEEDSYGRNSRHGGWDDDRYGRERDGDRYRDEDRYGRDWDRNGRVSDRSSRGGDRYRDDYNRDYDLEDDRYNSRRGGERQSDKYGSIEKDRNRMSDDDDRRSSRHGGGRGDDYGQDDRRPDRKLSDAKMEAPPSYEEVTGSSEYRASEEPRDGGGLVAAAARVSRSNTAQSDGIPRATSASSQVEEFDEFDPRSGPVPAAAAAPPLHTESSLGQTEPVGAVRALLPPPLTSLSSGLSINSSDLFGDSGTSGFIPGPATANSTSLQLDGDVFGGSPFKANMSKVSNSSTAFPVPANPPPSFMANPASNMGVSDAATNSFNVYAPAPPPSIPSQVSFDGDAFFGNDSFSAAIGSASNGAPPAASPLNPLMTPQQAGSSVFQVNQGAQPVPSVAPGLPPALFQVNHAQLAPSATPQHGALNSYQVNQAPPPSSAAPEPLLYSGASQAQIPMPPTKPQQEKKFETKSTVWSDTLNKGLIDLNIAGPKSNPLANIGIDFDLLRTERIREERASSASKSSTITMGKAMGSGSGLGMAGAGAIAPPTGPTMMSNVGMGMAPPMGMGMHPGMGMGPGMGMAMPMMPMGMNPGISMRPNMAMGPGMGMGMGMGVNPGMGMGMGMGAYPNQQQQYSGFR